MVNTTALKAVSRHLPLLRAPLLLNNVICMVLSGLCSRHPLYQAQLALIATSILTAFADLISCNRWKRASRSDNSNVDQAVHGASFITVMDGLLSVGLLTLWIVGLIAYSSRSGLEGIIATFGAFIAWSFHSTSFLIAIYVSMELGRPAIRRCPNCDYDLSQAAALRVIGDFQDQDEAQEQVPEPHEDATSVPSEHAENETDCLILKDEEDKS